MISPLFAVPQCPLPDRNGDARTRRCRHARIRNWKLYGNPGAAFSEAGHFIAPLLVGSLPRTFGLMLLGIAACGSGVLRHPAERRKLLLGISWRRGQPGALTTTLQVWSKETSQPPPAAFDWLYPYSVMLLAFAYAAGLLLC